VHSIYDSHTILTGQYWDDFLPLPALLDHPARSMVMIGNAAGTVPRGYRSAHPEIKVDGVEPDPQVTAAGNRYFDMQGENLTVTAADGRPFLQAAGRKRYDIVLVDAYRQPYIPFYLTTREFFELAKGHMQPGGVLAINIGSAPSDRRIDRAIAATMRDVFPLVVSRRSGDYNEVVIAVNDAAVSVDELRARVHKATQPSSSVNAPANKYDGGQIVVRRVPLMQPFDNLNTHDRTGTVAVYTNFADSLVERKPHPNLLLTDDRAPVEWMTDHMILSAAEAG
ncbi:MAG: fused MFS/spermidine synthase, partial [Thermoleophilia bacterium]|nr:fused MFS/spermidine synthase [Thermoleophilia bacterium]